MDAFATIQAAINGTAAGGAVNISQGNFVEQLTITKSLTLTGAGQANTIIRAGNAPLPPITIGSGANTTTINPIVFVTGATTTTTMKDLSVNGLLTGGASPRTHEPRCSCRKHPWLRAGE